LYTDHECSLGKIIDSEMCLNEIGKVEKKCWEKIPFHFMNLELDEFVIMPNHLHGIIIINNPIVGVQNFEPLQNKYQHIIPKSLGSIIRSFKAAVTHECWLCRHRDFRWQRNYYDHIIRNDRELNNIRDYIQNNVLRWAFEKNNLDNIPL